MKKIFIYITFLFCSFNLLQAQIVTKTKTNFADGVGVGITREEAVNNAIIEALGKLQGVKVSSKKYISTRSVQSSDGSYIKDSYSNDIQQATKGKVDSYSIDNIVKTPDGYEAYVTVKKTKVYKKYKTPGFSPHGRRKIAVVPIYSSDFAHNLLGQTYTSSKVTTHLSQEIVNAITQTRKFTVLDRDAKQAYNMEKNLILSDARKDELVKLGSVLGTDYLYVLNVSDFSIEDGGISNLTGVKLGSITNATIEYRIIVMATRQIKYSNTKNFSFTANGKNANQIFLNSLQTIATRLTDDIINNIYPIKIAGYSSGEVILSQKLKVGSRYDVFSLGERIYDSYTKEHVGYDEIKTGVIEITRSNPKMSYAKILEGSAKKGSLCRLSSDDITQDIYKPNDIEQTSGGGIILPFD